jgi:3-oxoacyl-[acyl-carrier-protein] synthase III
LKKDNVNLFVFHQADKKMMNYLLKLIDILSERFYYYLENVGNTASSTIPLVLNEAQKEGKLKGIILIAGFVVGYSWASTFQKT